MGPPSREDCPIVRILTQWLNNGNTYEDSQRFINSWALEGEIQGFFRDYTVFYNNIGLWIGLCIVLRPDQPQTQPPCRPPCQLALNPRWLTSGVKCI